MGLSDTIKHLNGIGGKHKAKDIKITDTGGLYTSDNVEEALQEIGDKSMTDPMTTRGDVIVRDSSNATARLGVGTDGQVLTSDGTDISWEDSVGGEASTGAVVKPTITDNGDGTIDIGTNGVVNYMTTADGVSGVIERVNATTGVTALALTDGVNNYVYSDYNAGSPIYAVTVNSSEFGADYRKIPLAKISKEGNELYMMEYDSQGILLANKHLMKDTILNDPQRQDGLTLSTSATRISTISSGSAWFSVERYSLAENVSGTSGTLTECYLTAGTWNKAVVTSYDSTYYSDGTDRQSLGTNKYVAKYFFRGIGDDNDVYYTHGDTYNSEASALSEAVPPTPFIISSHALYVGKIVIKQGETNGTAYPRAWGTSVVGSAVQNHDDLANINQAGTGIANGHIDDGVQTIAGVKTFSDGIVGDITGNADTATALETARNIAGQSFNGTADIDIASTDLTDTANIAKLDAANTFTNTGDNSFAGNVGIGTTSPAEKLDVIGDAHFSANGNSGVEIKTNSSNTGLITAHNLSPADPGTSTISEGANFGFNGAPSNFFGMGLGAIRNGKCDIWFQTGNINGGGYRFYKGITELVTISKDGDIGIDAPNPIEKLDIDGKASSSFIRMCNNNTGRLDNEGLYVGVAGTTGEGYIGTRHNKALHFRTNQKDALFIDINQNVGMNTTTPQFLLDLDKDIPTILKAGDDKPIYLMRDCAVGFNGYYDNGWKYGKGSSSDYAVYTAINAGLGTYTIAITENAGDDGDEAVFSEVVTITKDKNVGVGTTSPDTKLHIHDAESDATITLSGDDATAGIGRINFTDTTSGYTTLFNVLGSNRAGDDSNRLTLWTTPNGSNYHKYFTALENTAEDNSAGDMAFAGKIGIGTDAPTTELEVVGDITSVGTKWTARTSAANNGWYGIAYGNGMFVTTSDTGTGNRVMTSGKQLVNEQSNKIEHGEKSFTGNVGIGTTSPTSKLQVTGLPEYTNNTTATAGGLTAGAFYRTGDTLKVVH